VIRGTIVGTVWATRQARGLAGRKLVLVAERDAGAAASGRVVVAIDTLDAEAGQDVTVTFGSGARNAVGGGVDDRTLLCDAAVAAIVEGAG
jgi:microcompartment protein CcmK/EutM